MKKDRGRDRPNVPDQGEWQAGAGPNRRSTAQGRWNGTDRTTNERVQIKSAKELRREITDDETAWEGEIAEPTEGAVEPATVETPPESEKPGSEAAEPTEPAIATEGQQATPAPETGHPQLRRAFDVRRCLGPRRRTRDRPDSARAKLVLTK